MRWSFLVILPLLLFGLSFLLPVRDWVKAFSDEAANWGVLGGVLFILANAAATVLMVPGWVFTLTAGLLYGLGWGSLVAHTGSMTGAALAFLCGRYLVRSRVQTWLGHNKKFESIDRAVARKGWKIVAMIRLSPVIPFFLQNYLYSITRIGFWSYFLPSILCTLPGTILYVYLGAAGRYGVTGERPDGGPVQWVLLGVGFAATVAGTLYIRRVAKRALEHSVDPDG
jgi:uncharacterized membrane protein YdjX (TVP38/TMEM64 family)